MSLVYMTTPDHALMGQIAGELLKEGVAAGRIRVFGNEQDASDDFPVRTVRYHSPVSNMVFGSLVGGAVGLLLGLPLLMLGQFGLAPLLALVVASGVGAALLRVWFGYGPDVEMYRLEETLQRGDAVMVLDLKTARIAAVERFVKERHPQVRILGTDTQGSPPFP